MQIPNTESNSRYIQLCKAVGVEAHPARFPQKLPAFFIKFLTEPGDIVLDIFAGSNTTGLAAEELKRRWLAFEQDRSYLAASAFRFADKIQPADAITTLYAELMSSDTTIHVSRLAQLGMNFFQD